VQTQQPAQRPSKNLNLVYVSGCAPAKHRVERLTCHLLRTRVDLANAGIASTPTDAPRVIAATQLGKNIQR
jgi:hypothetical protein